MSNTTLLNILTETNAVAFLLWFILLIGGALVTIALWYIKMRQKQTEMLIDSTVNMSKSVSILNITMLEVRDATKQQWKKLSQHEVDIAILKSHQNGKA